MVHLLTLSIVSLIHELMIFDFRKRSGIYVFQNDLPKEGGTWEIQPWGKGKIEKWKREKGKNKGGGEEKRREKRFFLHNIPQNSFKFPFFPDNHVILGKKYENQLSYPKKILARVGIARENSLKKGVLKRGGGEINDFWKIYSPESVYCKYEYKYTGPLTIYRFYTFVSSSLCLASFLSLLLHNQHKNLICLHLFMGLNQVLCNSES